MATLWWKGDAQAVAQVITCTVGGTIETDDIFKITVGTKTLLVVAGSTSATTVAANIVAALGALSPTDWPEFTGSASGMVAATTSGGSFTLTAIKPGVPIAVTLTTTEGSGSAADSQTFTQSATTASRGRNDWSTPGNWSTGAIPVTGDAVILENSSADILYGLDQAGVTLASLSIMQSFTGKVGLARTNPAGYSEYRDQYLEIGATASNLGAGDGAGSGRIKLDTGSVQTTLNVHNSGAPAEQGLKAILWKGTHASNVVNVNKGSFAAAAFGDQVATIATLRQGYRSNQAGDSDTMLGPGCTLATLEKTGGTLEINSSFTTLNQTAGETIVAGGTPGTMNIYGGAVRYRSASNFTAANVADGGELDFRADMRAKNGSTCTLYKGAVLHDPFGVADIAGGYVLACCELADVTLDLGTNITLSRS